LNLNSGCPRCHRCIGRLQPPLRIGREGEARSAEAPRDVCGSEGRSVEEDEEGLGGEEEGETAVRPKLDLNWRTIVGPPTSVEIPVISLEYEAQFHVEAY